MPATSNLKRLDPTLVELELSVPAGELEKARERAFRELVRNVRLPGFRPGKAPRKLFEAHYGTHEIEERARDAVLNDAYSQALKENNLEPVERAHVEEVPTDGDSGDVRFRAKFAVRPEIALRQYKGLTVMSPSTAVSEKDVDDALESLRRGEAVLIPADRPVQFGDVATLSYEGKIDGTPFEGGKAENQPTPIEEGRFIPGLMEGIVGMSAGATRDIPVTFPSDYQKEELAGKGAIFTVTVHDVKAPELPELSDDFAARFARPRSGTAPAGTSTDAGEPPSPTLDDLRADIRRRLESGNRSRARQAMTGELLEKLRQDHDFPLPQVMVDRELDAMIEDAQKQAERAGVEWSDFLQRSGQTEEELREKSRPDAERRVKTGLLLEAVAKAENIRATEADIQREIASLAVQYGRSPQQILEQMRPNLPSLIDGIVRSKTLEFLLNSAQRVEAAT